MIIYAGCELTVPKKENSYRLLWMLGLALTLPMILLSGPLAGYLISELLVKKLGMPPRLGPIFMGLGLFGSAWQAYFLIRKMDQGRQEKGEG